MKHKKQNILDYISDYKKGILKFPLLDSYTWSDEKILDLFDSIKKGYPIGSILFWDNYVLDGLQRLSIIIGSLLHPDKTTKNENMLRINVVYDLMDDNFKIMKNEDLEYFQIPIYKLIDGKDFFNFKKMLIEKNRNEFDTLSNKYEEMSLTIQQYEIPSINVSTSLSDVIIIIKRLDLNKSSKFIEDLNSINIK